MEKAKLLGEVVEAPAVGRQRGREEQRGDVHLVARAVAAEADLEVLLGAGAVAVAASPVCLPTAPGLRISAHRRRGGLDHLRGLALAPELLGLLLHELHVLVVGGHQSGDALAALLKRRMSRL